MTHPWQANHDHDRPGLNRRAFLRSAGLAGLATILAGCGIATQSAPPEDIAPFLERHPLLPSPVAGPAVGSTSGTLAATPSPSEVDLGGFLALSALLTGIENLNPQVGQIYLDSLAANTESEISLADLYRQAGFADAPPPESIEELERRGIFAQDATRALADKVIEYWYSGVYDTANGEQAVATFADALVWRAVRYTKPLTLCAAPGFWAVAPQY
jgi:hypothetical protein